MLLNRARSLLWLRLLDPTITSAEQLQPADIISDEWGDVRLSAVLDCLSCHERELPTRLCKRLGLPTFGTSHSDAADHIAEAMERGKAKLNRK